MNCQFCNAEIPDNSEFCLLCGQNLKATKTDTLHEEGTENTTLLQSVENASSSDLILNKTHIPQKKSKFCKHCGGLIDSETRKCTSCGKNSFTISIKNLLIVISILLLITSITYFVLQRNTYLEAIAAAEENITEAEKNITEKESIINTLETDNASLEDKIKSLNTQLNNQITESKKKISLLEKDSKTLDVILSFLQSSNAGFASSKFKASDKIFVVDKNDIQTSFTLTCGFSGSTTVSTRNSGSSANIVFTQNQWYGATTKLLISPRSVGTTIITFSNDQNTQTFKILIVVID